MSQETTHRAPSGLKSSGSAPAGGSLDLGDIVITKNRYATQNVGTLGVSVTENRTIDSFESNSSGLKAGLVVGDVVTTIDGIDVTAATGSVVFALTLAPVGTTIRVGVARGVTITAVTAK